MDGDNLLKRPWLPSLICFFLLLSGLALRLISFNWNSRLHGDVNLFALTARELAINGKLQYPLKYEYFDKLPYLSLSTPASQHPPLWAWLGGMIARVLGNPDTFSILKGLGILSGMALLVALLATAWQMELKAEALVVLGLAALSPALVDFSANGSMYILTALILILANLLLLRFNPGNIVHYLMAGFLCGIGYLAHSSLLLLPVVYLVPLIVNRNSFWLSPNRQPGPEDRVFTIRQRLIGTGVFFLTFLITLSPWLAWNFRNFGQPFFSLSSYYLLDQLGMLRTEIFGKAITTHISQPFNLGILQNYLILVAKASLKTTRQFFQTLGPFALLLACFGMLRLIRKEKRKTLYALSMPPIMYGLAIILWGTYKFRFLIPLLPAAYLLAAIGFIYLLRLGGWRKTIGWLFLAGSLIWMGATYLQSQPTLYYGKETREDARLYDQMRPLAVELAKQETGVVLGIAETLDGGIETVYWTGLPFVAGRGLRKAEIGKLGHDFHARYLWADEATLGLARAAFPTARLILENPPFYVLELLP